MAIDYNQDIAPLRQQYFPMLIGERAFDQAMKYRKEVIEPMRDRTMKLRSNRMSLQQQELSFEKQKFDLRKQRDDIRRERDFLDTMPMIEDRMREIRESDLPAVDKREEFTNLAMDNLGAINNSTAISSMFTFQDKLLQSRASVEAKEKQKEQGFRNTLANSYVQTLLPTGGFDEGVYKGIIDGSVGGSAVSEILNIVYKDTAAARGAGKKQETPYEVKYAQDSLEWVQKLELSERYPSPTEIKNGAQENTEIPFLKSTDFRQLLDRLLITKGKSLNPQNRIALTREEGYSASDPSKPMEHLTQLSTNKVMIHETGETSFSTEGAEDRNEQVKEAFGQQ